MARLYTASATARVERTFTCERCGLEAGAAVLGEGVGAGRSDLVLDDDAARINAVASAENEAVVDAETVLDVVPCPKCGHRDENGVARFGRATSRRIRIAIALCLLPATAAGVLFRIWLWPFAIAISASAVIGLAIATWRRREMARAASRVRFELPEAVPSDWSKELGE